MDRALRRLAICISVVELAVLVRYYVPLLCNVPWFDLEHVDAKQYDDSFVSDLLFNNRIYRMVVSVLVALQLGICSFFVIQLNQNQRRAWCCLPVMGVELFMLTLAWLGWIVVTAVYLDSEGHMTVGHITGAGLFITACGLYFLLMMVNVLFLYPNKWSMREWLLFGLATLCFVSSVVVGCIFAASFFTKAIRFGWAFEHAAFILFVAAHICLFIVDGWLEEDLKTNDGVGAPRSGFGGVRIHRADVGY